jgi:uncharacterized protein (DUF305 family)
MNFRIMATLTLSALMLAACSPNKEPGKIEEKETISAAAQAFKLANDKMHKDMAVALTGDADVDFMQSMIPHHEGAVAMARVALEHGKNPEVRKLAEEVIKAQKAEIVLMRDWLTKNGEMIAKPNASDHANH